MNYRELMLEAEPPLCIACGQIDEEGYHDAKTCPGGGGAPPTCEHKGAFNCWVGKDRAQACEDCKRVIWQRGWGGTPLLTDWEWFAGPKEEVNAGDGYPIGGCNTRDKAIELATRDYRKGEIIVLIEAQSSAADNNGEDLVPFINTRNREEMTM